MVLGCHYRLLGFSPSILEDLTTGCCHHVLQGCALCWLHRCCSGSQLHCQVFWWQCYESICLRADVRGTVLKMSHGRQCAELSRISITVVMEVSMLSWSRIALSRATQSFPSPRCTGTRLAALPSPCRMTPSLYLPHSPALSRSREATVAVWACTTMASGASLLWRLGSTKGHSG